MFSFGNKKPKYTANDIVKIYTERGTEIFPKGGWMDWSIFNKASNLFYSCKYRNKGLVKVLKEYMGNVKMEELLNECIVMATECSEEYTVKFKRDGFQKLEIRRAVLASTSAPTYLPKAEIAYNGKLMTLVDGGVTMNNPAEYVYDHAL